MSSVEQQMAILKKLTQTNNSCLVDIQPKAHVKP